MPDLEKAVRSDSQGTYIDISVTPDSTKCIFPAGYNKWRKKIDINVSSPAKDNKANKEILMIFSNFFNKNIEDIFIVNGKKNKNKTILVKNISFDAAVKKLQESLDGL